MQTGRKIIIVTETPDGATERDGVVEKVEAGKIYITDVLIPFDEINGEQEGSSEGTRIYIKQVKGVMGNSKEAIANQSLSPIVSKELAIEMLTNLTRSIIDGKGDVTISSRLQGWTNSRSGMHGGRGGNHRTTGHKDELQEGY